MKVALIIILYVGNVFLNRWLNFIACKKDKYEPPIPLLWFLSLVGTFVYLIAYFEGVKKPKWMDEFLGNNWNGTKPF